MTPALFLAQAATARNRGRDRAFPPGGWLADNSRSHLFQAAETYHRAGRLNEAAEVLRKGLVLRPGDLAARELLAAVLVDGGEEDAALAELLGAAGELAGFAGIFSRLAELQAARGLAPEAAQARELASRLNDFDEDTPAAAARREVRGKLKEAAQVYHELLAPLPASAEPENPPSPGLTAAPPPGKSPRDRVLGRLEGLARAARQRAHD